MKPSDFIHPEDAAALRQLESLPGFPSLVKKFYALGYEKLFYGMNMAKCIRLSETQLPELYKHLPPICKTLGIAEPEFYLEMNPMPNAYTFGDTKIFITVTSGLVEMMEEEELDAVIAHECGHILCRHVLYHNLAQLLLEHADGLGILGALTAPLRLALLYWMRKSELSCDRCGAIITSPETVTRVMARLAGGPKNITKNVDMRQWASQADQYDLICKEGLWNKTLQLFAVMSMDHPFAAVRVREILQWGDSAAYANIRANMVSESSNCCPGCGRLIDTEWQFCLNCGTRLK